MLRAYIMLECDPAVRDVEEQLRTRSLGNCKLGTAAMHPDGEIVGHLACDDMSFLQTALLELSTQIAGVREVTVLRIVNEG
ncbi:hypothetical protein [Catellatospora sichuanensis]|uniref:hypothetical protein n=1 Tax=Catellatospora sichuanensis TaxID=1969805 RepID=UPI00118401F4|nr:hypothetical protein [Catellatospora sichuanensis]